jgi:GxxExxY protein
MDEQAPYVDEDMEPDPKLNRLTNLIIGAAIEVHRQLGAGLLELHYGNALAHEFVLRDIPFTRQVCVPVIYKQQIIGETRLDFLVAGQVIVEIKAVEMLGKDHTSQILCYLKITGHKLGLLINFNVGAVKDGIKRAANSKTKFSAS